MARILTVKTFTDARGNLAVLDRDLPFAVKGSTIVTASARTRCGGHDYIDEEYQ